MSDVAGDPTAPTAERVAHLLGRMTLSEKIEQMRCLWGPTVPPEPAPGAAPPGAITHFVRAGRFTPQEAVRHVNAHQRAYVEASRLGIPALFSEEVMCGLQVDGATILPDGLGQASTWDPDLIEELGGLVRRQMTSLGLRQALGPVLDVARDPRWGRIEETYGEDPYLVGSLATAYVRGVQGARQGGVAAVAKHYVAHGASEGGRHMQPAHLGTRELHEVHGLPFEMAIRDADLRGVMSTYHQIDQVPVQASPELLTTVLREEYGFEGIVLSDLGAVTLLHTRHLVTGGPMESGVLALRSGLDMDMPGSCFSELAAAVEEGLVSEDVVDAAVARVLRGKFELGLFEQPYADEAAAPVVLDTEADRRVVRRAATRSIVLLQNEGDVLPLGPHLRSVAVIGPNADRALALLGNYSYPVATAALQLVADAFDPATSTRRQASADELVAPEVLVSVPTVLDALRERVGHLRFARGCGVADTDTSGFSEALEAAYSSDVAVVVVGDQAGIMTGATVGEGLDSMTCELPGVQRQLVEAVAATGTPVVVVLCNGRPFVLGWMTPIVAAIVEAWFPGEEGAAAIADVLFGVANPGGKLPVSFPRAVGSLPRPYNAPSGTFVPDQRIYYEGSHDPLFPFGHGLSYTTFELSDLVVDPPRTSTAGRVSVSCRVANVGPGEGDEVVQLYLRDAVGRTARPPLELKGFRRLTLAPGQTTRVAFDVAADRLALYDPPAGWVVEPGRIEVMVGTSARDIRLRGEFELTGSAREGRRGRALVTPTESLAPRPAGT